MLSCYTHTAPQIFWLLHNPWSSLRKVAQLKNQFVFIVNTKTGEIFCSKTKESTMDTFSIQVSYNTKKKRSLPMSRTVFIPDSQSWISTEAIKKCIQFRLKLIFRGKHLVWQVANKPFRLSFPSDKPDDRKSQNQLCISKKEKHLISIFGLQLVH